MNFGEYVLDRHAAGELVVQPRMGFGDPAAMRAGLAATRRADATTVGTVTLDSYTRVGDLASVEHALREGIGLNGYPIVTHPEHVTREVVDGHGFPVQVRHGSARPLDIFAASVRCGLTASEGGPVSYCLPYGRTPLDESVRNWSASCELLAEYEGAHLETFGGCMMGQLCPPGLLVAISVLEAIFFHRKGVRGISVSYAQQTNADQDRDAIAALRRLCAELLPGASWHVVVYAYMGLFPATPEGSRRLLASATELAVSSGAERLIVKTVAEAVRIPTIAENVDALEYASLVARAQQRNPASSDNEVYAEARALVDAVLNCDADLGRALVLAFKRGLLDVPFCLHPDNAGRARSYLETDGTLRWAELGGLPLTGRSRPGRAITSSTLMAALSHVRQTFDAPVLQDTSRGELA